MVKQYPHFLYKLTAGSYAAQNEEGNWVSADPTWEFHSACREETNGKGSLVQGPDGKSIVFSSLVLLPKGAAKLTEGTTVRVVNSEDPASELRIERPVLKCDISQMHGRLWL